MKNIFKKQNGIAAIAVILIVVLSVAAGGTAFLGVRSIVTGEPFLQPFEDMGLMEIEENDEKKEDVKENKDKVEADEDLDIEDNRKDDHDKEKEKLSPEGEDSSLLVTDINDAGVECYTIVVDLKEVADGVVPVIEQLLSMYMSAGSDMLGGTTDTTTEEELIGDIISEALVIVTDIFTDCEIIIDCYANGNDIKQVLITFPYEQFVKNMYNEMSNLEETMKKLDPTADIGFDYTSYEECLEDFEDTFKAELTTENLREVLSEELGTEYQEIIDSAECVMEDGKIQISMDLTSIDIDSYIEEYRDELEELGIDPDNVVEDAVDTWNEYIDELGYDGLIESAMSTVMGAYNMLSY